jgi:hypothetical protein
MEEINTLVNNHPYHSHYNAAYYNCLIKDFKECVDIANYRYTDLIDQVYHITNFMKNKFNECEFDNILCTIRHKLLDIFIAHNKIHNKNYCSKNNTISIYQHSEACKNINFSTDWINIKHPITYTHYIPIGNIMHDRWCLIIPLNKKLAHLQDIDNNAKVLFCDKTKVYRSFIGDEKMYYGFNDLMKTFGNETKEYEIIEYINNYNAYYDLYEYEFNLIDAKNLYFVAYFLQHDKKSRIYKFNGYKYELQCGNQEIIKNGSKNIKFNSNYDFKNTKVKINGTINSIINNPLKWAINKQSHEQFFADIVIDELYIVHNEYFCRQCISKKATEDNIYEECSKYTFYKCWLKSDVLVFLPFDIIYIILWSGVCHTF